MTIFKLHTSHITSTYIYFGGSGSGSDRGIVEIIAEVNENIVDTITIETETETETEHCK